MKIMGDLETLARTLYGESEVNDIEDAEAIANTVLTRTKAGKWPKTIANVCRQPSQYSCWNSDNPQLGDMLTVTKRSKWFSKCWEIAERAIAGELEDKTNGATHYYASYWPMPKWARGKTPCYETAAGKYTHLFFNDIDTPKPRTKTAAKVTAGVTVTATAISAVSESGLLDHAKQAGEIAAALEPVASFLGGLGQLLPYVLGIGALVLVGWLIWARLADRNDGGRT